MKTPVLVSDEYREQLEKIHSTQEWGNTAKNKWKEITNIAEELQETTILDYGAGQGSLRKKLQEEFPDKYTIVEYEPGKEKLSALPAPPNCVVCIDVLEHVETELVDNVLDDLKRVTIKKGMFSISTRLAQKILPDGRNAHLTVKPLEWWEPKLKERFNILHVRSYEDGAEFTVEAKNEEL